MQVAHGKSFLAGQLRCAWGAFLRGGISVKILASVEGSICKVKGEGGAFQCVVAVISGSVEGMIQDESLRI